jgi:hypothetical protein
MKLPATLLVVAAIGCAPSPDPAIGARSEALISDQVHDDGQTGFFFLPPVVDQPQLAGDLDAALAPVVAIDEIDPVTASPLQSITRFTDVPIVGQQFAVDWHTGQFALPAPARYRISVLVAGRVVGIADVDLLASRASVRRTKDAQEIPLVDGQTLPIRFFANRCAAVVCAALDSCHAPGVCDPASGACSNPTEPDGTTCPLPNAAATCSACACTINRCATGFADCDGAAADGCEARLDLDGNCGGCGVACAAADGCHLGRCVATGGIGACMQVDASACAVPFCQLPSGACAGWSDADGDGLSDAWERNGYVDLDCGGRNGGPDVDLQLPGADPAVPDIFVRYDWLELVGSGAACTTSADCPQVDEVCTGGACAGHTHDPEALAPGSMALVADRFAARGFNLHILRGVARPHSRVVSFEQPTAGCEGADVSPGVLGAYAVNLFDLKTAAPAPPSSHLAYHYAVFGHYSSCDSFAHCLSCQSPLNADGTPKTSSPVYGQSGIGELPGNDFIVSLGRILNDLRLPPDRFVIGGTFMHELGHNLGLHHGGGGGTDTSTAQDTPSSKPNYLSVMNYRYQIIGIQQADAPGSAVPDPSLRRLDYATQVLPTGGNTPGRLDEDGLLSEPAGLGSGGADLFTFSNGRCRSVLAATDGPVDWDGDGVADNPNATADLDPANHPSVACGTLIDPVLTGAADWGPAPGQSIFRYDFQCTSSFADGTADGYAQGELTPERAAERHVLYPALPARVAVAEDAAGIELTVFGGAELDVERIDLASLQLAGAAALTFAERDADGDGHADLIARMPQSMHALTQKHPCMPLVASGSLASSQLFAGEVAARD